MLCALDLLNEYHLKTIDIVGELCQAGHTLSAFSDEGLRKLHEELLEKNAFDAEENLKTAAKDYFKNVYDGAEE